MKLKTLFLFLAFVYSSVLFAEDYKVDLFDVKTVQTQDSVIVSSLLQVKMKEMPTRNQLRFTPVIVVDGKDTDFGPVVLLNGKKQHYKYKCKAILDKNNATVTDVSNEMAYEYEGGVIQIEFRGAVAFSKANKHTYQLFFRHEMIDSYGDVISAKMKPIKASAETSSKSKPAQIENKKQTEAAVSTKAAEADVLALNVAADDTTISKEESEDLLLSDEGIDDSLTSDKKSEEEFFSNDRNDLYVSGGEATGLDDSSNDIVQLKQDQGVIYKGTYLQPAEDAIYLRNKKELRFSLDEAKIIAEINPSMLSLKELYAVAQGYSERSAMFHKIIKVSVDLYPSNPIANLNAAASAIELGNVDAAATYLQVAPHDTLAYRNCRGAYELMRNNVQEGLRLLKAASAEGSTEATENLKKFFESFRQK